MNLNLDSTLMVIVILLLIVIVALIVVSIFLALNYFKRNKEQSTKATVNLKKTETDSITESIGLCKNHDDKTSVGICAICEDEFCLECLKQIENVSLCPEHFSTYASNTWVPITNQRTTPNEPEEGVYIYKFKQHLWAKKKKPSFILNDYKIQVENDFIETYVQLHVVETDHESLKEELNQFKRNLSDD
jgi:MFS superfamily sulfate permease-like transporter